MTQLQVASLTIHSPSPNIRHSATLDEAQTATFAPGTLRFEVSATVIVAGLPLFDAMPVTAEYTNKRPATAIRGTDGSFQFRDATFTIGAYTAALHTAPSVQ